jgi:hypothetical protein
VHKTPLNIDQSLREVADFMLGRIKQAANAK